MTIDKYIEKSKVCYDSILNKVKINDESASGDIENLVINAFNEGIFSQMTSSSKKIKSTGEMNEYLPDFFVESKIVEEMKTMLINNIKAQTTNSFLNAGYKVPIQQTLVNIIKTVYMIGLNSGFEIASNNSLKEMYLSDKERFIVSDKTV
jgi:hypothetical protein